MLLGGPLVSIYLRSIKITVVVYKQQVFTYSPMIRIVHHFPSRGKKQSPMEVPSQDHIFRENDEGVLPVKTLDFRHPAAKADIMGTCKGQGPDTVKHNIAQIDFNIDKYLNQSIYRSEDIISARSRQRALARATVNILSRHSKVQCIHT